LPSLDAQPGSDALDVGDQMPCRVVFNRCVRCALAAPALIEEDDVIGVWVEELPLSRIRAAAGSAMQEDDGLSLRVA
jgi:hypothetical protein